MKKMITIVLAGISVLLASLVMLYGLINLFPSLMEEYYDPIFRSNSFETDWLFYLHPFVLSVALSFFWDYSKQSAEKSVITTALKTSLIYGLMAILPMLLLTFSAINISALMVFTWFAYGIIQTFIALIIFAYREK